MNRPAAIAVWDAPTRIFHWSLVALFALSWWSAENGRMDLHTVSGVTLVGLLTFRLLWGIVGSSTARFANFIRGPRGIAAYLKGDEPPLPGHNPLGGWSVIAMLALLAVQVGTGLFAVDVDGLESGPLSYLVDFDQGRLAAEVHEYAFNALLVLTGLHVLAIIFYLVVRRRNLIHPMVTGKDIGVSMKAEPLKPAKWWVFAATAAIALAFAWWVSNGGSFVAPPEY